MEAFKTIIWIINIFSSLAIIGLVLMQHGKGADAGASIGGSGSAQGVFGSGGNANFLTRMTGIAASIFFATCLALGYIHTNHHQNELNFNDVQQSQTSNVNPMVAASAVDSNHQASVAASASESHADHQNSQMATAAAATAATATAKAALDNSKKAEEKERNTDKNSKKTALAKEKEKTSTSKKTSAKTNTKTVKH